jgi:signal recognition particle GTPase
LHRDAGREFGKAASHTVKRKGQEASRAIDRLYDILLSHDLSNDQSDALAQGVLDELKEEDIQENEILRGLETMCRQILVLDTI